MINPFKFSEGINKFYVDSTTSSPVHPEKINLTGLGQKCKPDMDWIYKKCMLKSDDFKLMLENNYKATYMIHDVFIKKQPELLKKFKKQLVNPDNAFNYYDTATMTPVFNSCSMLYQDLCRTFYEKKSLNEEFRI